VAASSAPLIPRGIVLPWLPDGELRQRKIRGNRQHPKYLAINGGHPCLSGPTPSYQ
jgi:hypothetical protein